jgi:isopenicillin-N epimerase
MAEAEANPTRIAAERGDEPLRRAQEKIAQYIGADPKNVIFHVNVTHALNQALMCLKWPKEGEFIASDQEYGAIVNAARAMAKRNGLSFRTFEIPPRPRSPEEVCDAVLKALTPATVGVLVSHITTRNGLVTPVERLGELLRARNVRLIVDGAHGPGLLPLKLGSTQIDIYGGALHKWFMGPKGTAFLYVAGDLHGQMQPHIVGWGGTPEDSAPVKERLHGWDYRFQHIFRLQGLVDFSAFLALPAALNFREGIGEERILSRIASLAEYVRRRLEGDLKLQCLSPPADMNAGLVSFVSPEWLCTPDASEKIFQRYRITIPVWHGPRRGNLLRVSAHIWNLERDIDRLAEALSQPS